MDDKLHDDTRAIHGDEREDAPEHAGVFPLYMSSSFGFASVEEGARIARGSDEGYMYTRQSNPTTDRWVKRIAQLEGAAGGCAVGSGMAAISNAVMHLARAGENLVAANMLYSGTYRFFRDILPRYGIECRFVNLRDFAEVESRVDDKTRVLYFESPDNPLLHTAAMVYASDTTVLDTIITTHGLSWGWDRIFAVTVNHSMWFHRPVDFGDWVLYSTASPVAAESRGLGTGHFFNSSGQVVATVVQEGIVKHFPGH